MTDTEKSNRLPFYLALAGAFLLIAVGVYMYQTRAATPTDVASVADKDADAAIAASGMSDGDRKATEAVVRAYILEHPEIITEAVAILQSREMAARLDSVGDALFAPFAGDVAGNPDGDITVVEFTDYNCGYCRATLADVEKLLKTDGKIRLIYRELPILAPTSRDAALWGLAAAKQGKHHAFHQAMFAAGKPDSASIRKAAQNIGLDIAAAEKFAASTEANAELDANLAMMQKVGFNGTPTFIIGNQILEGAQGYERLKETVKKARKQG